MNDREQIDAIMASLHDSLPSGEINCVTQYLESPAIHGLKEVADYRSALAKCHDLSANLVAKYKIDQEKHYYVKDELVNIKSLIETDSVAKLLLTPFPDYLGDLLLYDTELLMGEATMEKSETDSLTAYFDQMRKSWATLKLKIQEQHGLSFFYMEEHHPNLFFMSLKEKKAGTKSFVILRKEKSYSIVWKEMP